MADVHFDLGQTSTIANQKEITAMQGATAVVAALVEKDGRWIIESGTSEMKGSVLTEALTSVIKEVKAALLADV